MKIFCVGRNYADHAKEMNSQVQEEPVIFSKPPTALLRDGRPFYYPDFSNEVHYEGELVIRINKNGKNIQEKFAHKYYDELTFGIDFTARDIQQSLKDRKLPWEISKGFDGAAVIGDFIKLSELKVPKEIQFQTLHNGRVAQEGNTRDMVFSFDQIIAYVSKFFMLQKGDLIYTGTPAGVGPVKIGDTLEGKIEGQSLMQFEVK